jgi:hypothetical protein
LALIADRLTGNALHYAGKQREAQRNFERVLELYVAPKNERHMIWTRFDQRLMSRAMLAPVLWLWGFVDQGLTQAQVSLEEAHAADHKLTLCWVLHYAAYPVALMTGDLAAAGHAVAMLKDLAISLSAPFWKTLAQCLEGKLLIRRGELWFVAELLRIKGEVLLDDAGDRSISAAEHCFSAALEAAREQDALSWELRTALSFARMRIRKDRQDDAGQFLAPVYNRFTEGFETPDLRSASAILQSLPSHPAEFAR